METRRGLLAANEAWFREINDQIEIHALEHGSESHRYDFICECADLDCVERVTLPLADYKRVRAHPTRFVIAPGHVYRDVENVVERDGYWIVEKLGRAAGVVSSRDA